MVPTTPGRAVLLTLLAAALAAGADAAPTTPKAGSAERKAILEPLRRELEKSLKQKVIFRVNHLKVQGNWAFVSAVPRQPSGRPIDYRRTRYREDVEAGVFDDWVCALFQRKSGRWTMRRYSLGATDVAWEGWDREFRAPRAIFPYP